MLVLFVRDDLRWNLQNEFLNGHCKLFTTGFTSPHLTLAFKDDNSQ